ncbi:hypothetical protein CEXT_188741 [Caerostris extrusa]|uniref:Uncharacterized protein n=1 Tax=Caerostris extrusa TaxID=172846 RepID=A0AAV4XFQ9_CAEEX|nr:hypothetical protein CEXT_188741 [Caerostris extrusa]
MEISQSSATDANRVQKEGTTVDHFNSPPLRIRNSTQMSDVFKYHLSAIQYINPSFLEHLLTTSKSNQKLHDTEDLIASFESTDPKTQSPEPNRGQLQKNCINDIRYSNISSFDDGSNSNSVDTKEECKKSL